MEQEDQISRLLRLKRYEQPPPGYFEDFLSEFQARQRAELIKRPVWAIVWDRLSASLSPTFEVPRLAYAGVAALALAAIAVIWNQPHGEGGAGAELASVGPDTTVNPVTIGKSLPVTLTSGGRPPVQYVLPASPAGYAQPRSF